jgi:hypothetical protein
MSEARYLAKEAFPDWKHKAARIERELHCHKSGPATTTKGSRSSRIEASLAFTQWLSTLSDEACEWKKVAEGVEGPDFDQAVVDLTALQAITGAFKTGSKLTAAPEAEVFQDDERLRKIEKVDSGIDF